jgi:hypothetical protein
MYVFLGDDRNVLVDQYDLAHVFLSRVCYMSSYTNRGRPLGRKGIFKSPSERLCFSLNKVCERIALLSPESVDCIGSLYLLQLSTTNVLHVTRCVTLNLTSHDRTRQTQTDDSPEGTFA